VDLVDPDPDSDPNPQHWFKERKRKVENKYIGSSIEKRVPMFRNHRWEMTSPQERGLWATYSFTKQKKRVLVGSQAYQPTITGIEEITIFV
jgi:hypothetical protein